MSKESRLHPLSLVVHLIQNIRKSIFPMIVFGITLTRSSEGNIPLWVVMIISCMIAFLLIAAPLIKYLTFFYRIDEGGIRIRHGLINRKHIYIPYERIQTIQQKQWFFFKPFNLTEVSIETAASGAVSEANLSAVPEKFVNELNALRTKKVEDTNETDQLIPEVEQPLLTIHIAAKELLLMAVTSGGLFGVAIIIISLFDQLRDFISDTFFKKFVDEQFQQLMNKGFTAIIVIIIFAIILLSIIAIFRTMIKYYNFKLSKYKDRLVIERGLLYKNVTTISLEKIQAIEIIESPLRQVFKLTSVKVALASSIKEDTNEGAFGEILLLPIMNRRKVITVLKQLFDQHQFPINYLGRLPQSRLKWFLIPNFLITGLIAAGTIIFLFPYGLLGLLLPVAAVIWAIASHKATGYQICQQELTLQFRQLFSRKTYFILRNKIQSVEKKQNLWMQRQNLAHFTIDAYSSHAKVKFLDENIVNQLYNWYRPK